MRRWRRLARWLVPVVALVAVGFTLHGGETIVALLLMGYSFVTQLFPALICSLLPRNPRNQARRVCGIVVGVAVVAVMTMTNASVGQLLPFLPDVLKDVNIGFIALTLNLAALAVVSAATRGAIGLGGPQRLPAGK